MIIGSRGASMIRAITVAALCTLSPFAHAQEITGEWAGRYICNQGVTQLHLTIQKTGAGKGITATFNFGPPPENPDVPKGAYAMRGTYDPATRRMKLEGERWLKQPIGYVMVGLDGKVAQTGENITGYIPDLLGCTDFEVRRTAELIG
jgi:hypothetical protein